MQVTFHIQTKSGSNFTANYVIIEGVASIENTIKRIEENKNNTVLYYECDGEIVICDSKLLQNQIPDKGRGSRFSNYHQCISEYCKDKKIAHLAKVVWFGRATGRLNFDVAYFLDCATASKICKFLIKNRHHAVDNYETTLAKISL